MDRDEAIGWLRENHPGPRGLHTAPHYSAEGPMLFYGGTFSNFVGPSIWTQRPLDGALVEYPTVEHWFAANKANHNMALHEAIRKAAHPGVAKGMGRQIRMTEAMVQDWDERKYQVMLDGLMRKFAHGTTTALFLLSSGHRYIAEVSPTDAVWGIWNPEDRDWTGLNLLGMALMEVRAHLPPPGA